MASSPAAVIDQMMAAGMPPLPVHELQVNTQRVVRYGPKKRAWYRVFEVQGRRGRSYYVGAFGSHGHIESTRLAFDDDGIDADDLARIRAAADAVRKQEEQRKVMRAARARMSAREAWSQASTKADAAPYLVRKGVVAESVRVEPDGVLVVPMIRYDLARDRALVGLQRIWPDGAKRFTSGMAKPGSAVRLGVAPVNGEALLICEGLATGLSVRMACAQSASVFVAFDAGNLIEVALIMRELYPDSPIGFCADDDFLTVDNPGHLYALRAAKKVGQASVARPTFHQRVSQKWTDFNDLHVQEGLPEVRRQVMVFLAFLRSM